MGRRRLVSFWTAGMRGIPLTPVERETLTDLMDRMLQRGCSRAHVARCSGISNPTAWRLAHDALERRNRHIRGVLRL